MLRSSPASGLPVGRLGLWLAALLFVLQVGMHAAMPAGMTMPQMLSALLASPAAASPMNEMDEMTHPAAVPPPVPIPAPLHPATKHSAQSLCCMPPLALVPLLWAPAPLLPTRLRLAPPRAIREALRIRRATARGPPEQR